MSRVLLVSPDARASTLASSALGAEGYGVDAVQRADAAYRLAARGAYDVVLYDLVEPAPAGMSFLRTLFAERPDQAVLVVSALDCRDSKLQCLELGAFDFLCKPFDVTELTLRVRNAVRRLSSLPLGQELRAGRLRLDVRRRTIDSGNGSAVTLSAREFLLLQHLMMREGDVCSRAEILADVWGYGFDPGTNVVDVYIGRLRSKLGVGVLETVRGVGYCLHAPS